MSTFLLLSLLSLTIFSTLSSSHRHHLQQNPHQIRLACQSTRFPQLCETSLTQSSSLPSNPTPLQLIQSAISVSSKNLKTGQSLVKSILANSKGDLNRTNVAILCIDLLSYSDQRINSTLDGLNRGKIKDARAWMSATLAYQNDCWGGLQYVNDTTQLALKTITFLESLMQHTSNALSMMAALDNHGDNMNSWDPPKTERDGFYEKGSGSGTALLFNGSFPTGLKPDVTVCKHGSRGCYKTVQEAVNAAPDNADTRRFVIAIKEGVYEETVRVPLMKKNVVFLGDGIGKTVITGSLNVGQIGMTTYNSATVGE